jgi:predicted O-methyltransferase YrrM
VQPPYPPPHPLLAELEQRARDAGMLTISPETGRFLSTIVTAMQANRILEVGTAYGYATLWMALAQPSVGRIWTIDSEAARTDIARSYFRRAAEDDFIEVFNTPALELLENFPHRNLDIVFVAANPRSLTTRRRRPALPSVFSRIPRSFRRCCRRASPSAPVDYDRLG